MEKRGITMSNKLNLTPNSVLEFTLSLGNTGHRIKCKDTLADCGYQEQEDVDELVEGGDFNEILREWALNWANDNINVEYTFKE